MSFKPTNLEIKSSRCLGYRTMKHIIFLLKNESLLLDFQDDYLIKLIHLSECVIHTARARTVNEFK